MSACILSRSTTRPSRAPARARFVPAHAADKLAALAELQKTKSGLSQHLGGVSDTQEQVPEPSADGSPSESVAKDTEDIELINQENYYDRIKNADAPVVVVDFYTQWCGPCKLMYPKLLKMKAELAGEVTFYKFDCNKKNKDLGKELGIRVAPTFFIYKNEEHVETITGAKLGPLKDGIASACA